MRLLIDTNIFLHAVNTGSPDHEKASLFLQKHFRDQAPLATTWPILYEFLRVATHHRVFTKPLKAKQALDFVEELSELDHVLLLGATERHSQVLATVVKDAGQPSGNLFHDIHTATLMREHGISEIATADADFLRFRFLKVVNPLL